jgi:hypothetical protein
MKMSGKGLGLAAGLVWGGGILIVGLIATYLGVKEGSSYYGKDFMLAMASVYPGYRGTPELGASLIGALYGFFDGVVGGVIFAWIYNRFSGASDS